MAERAPVKAGAKNKSSEKKLLPKKCWSKKCWSTFGGSGKLPRGHMPLTEGTHATGAEETLYGESYKMGYIFRESVIKWGTPCYKMG